MKGPFSLKRAEHWDIGFWLVFDSGGGVRLTRSEPNLSRTERGMAVDVKVPHSLFRTPSLRASMEIQAPMTVVEPIDLTAAAEALKLAIGCDIDMRVVEPESVE